jgi:uncharacterized protein involved in cysteine biosynthesis
VIGLPFLALKLLFTRPRLFVLGVFPGLFTFAIAAGATYLAWHTFLQGKMLVIAIPVMMATFFLSWLLFGNLSLLPVEDAIVDECQRAVHGELLLPPQPITLKRLAREAFFSMLLVLLALFLVLLAEIPPLALAEFVAASWLGAYGFLSTIYSRRVGTASGRLTLFFEHPISNFLLGALLNLLLFVPVLNVFLLGYAQVLAALLYFKREAAHYPASDPRTFQK